MRTHGDTSDSAAREPYQAPAVEVLGSIEDITACGSGSSTDTLGGAGPSGI